MDAKTFAREIETYVRPATFPVAARMLPRRKPSGCRQKGER